MKSVKIQIVGPRVQGIGFRYFIWERANRLGVKGYVKNLYDGSVEVEAHGNDKAVEKLIEYIKEGPQMAIIENVIVNEIPPKEYTDFSIKR